MPDIDYADEEEFEEEEIEAFCVSCKTHTIIESPIPVWTRKGAAATKGICQNCGATVFRMGKTDAHREAPQPTKTDMFGKSTPPARGSRAAFAVYMNYAPEDKAQAEKLSEELDRIGIPIWFDPEANHEEEVSWASGVHPGLAECTHMIVVMTKAAYKNERVQQEWEYFRDQRRPVVVAYMKESEVPDALRSRPRFDFTDDYKMAFRGLSEALFV